MPPRSGGMLTPLSQTTDHQDHLPHPHHRRRPHHPQHPRLDIEALSGHILRPAGARPRQVTGRQIVCKARSQRRAESGRPPVEDTTNTMSAESQYECEESDSGRPRPGIRRPRLTGADQRGRRSTRPGVCLMSAAMASRSPAPVRDCCPRAVGTRRPSHSRRRTPPGIQCCLAPCCQGPSRLPNFPPCC